MQVYQKHYSVQNIPDVSACREMLTENPKFRGIILRLLAFVFGFVILKSILVSNSLFSFHHQMYSCRFYFFLFVSFFWFHWWLHCQRTPSWWAFLHCSERISLWSFATLQSRKMLQKSSPGTKNSSWQDKSWISTRIPFLVFQLAPFIFYFSAALSLTRQSSFTLTLEYYLTKRIALSTHRSFGHRCQRKTTGLE